jgi:signal transduction histidine kinase
LEGRLAQTGGRVELAGLPALEADALQMRQLLQNLIGNALKFHKPGQPPTVKISAREIPNTDGPPTGHPGRNGHPPRAFEIRFQDDGIGFDPKYLDRIFNVFQRLHGRNEYEGTGMGLAICRKIVERHHGQITAQSQSGAGATFILTLPVQQPDGGLTRESVAEANHDSDGG